MKWKLFKIADIFKNTEIHKGKSYAQKHWQKGKLPCIASSKLNNGIVSYIKHTNHLPNSIYSNFIGVNNTGSVGYAFYHKDPAYVQSTVTVLDCSRFTINQALFICTSIRMQRHNFSYGYGLNNTRLKNLKIWLPVNTHNNMDKTIMDKIIQKTIHNTAKTIRPIKLQLPKLSLKSKAWKQFTIQQLFTIKRGKRIPKRSRHQGNIPFIGATSQNNGVTDTIDTHGISNGYHRNVIGVNYNGTPGYAFYHPALVYLCDDVIALGRKDLNTPEALFLVTCIKQQRYKFNYGFKLTQKRLRNLKINLPINKDGKPDWIFMQNYIKQMVTSKQ